MPLRPTNDLYTLLSQYTGKSILGRSFPSNKPRVEHGPRVFIFADYYFRENHYWSMARSIGAAYRQNVAKELKSDTLVAPFRVQKHVHIK